MGLNPELARHSFRARYGIENGRLIRTFEWTGILEIDSSSLVFRVLSLRLQNIRISMLAIFPLLVAWVAMLILWGWLTPYLFSHVPEAWWVVLAIIGLASKIASFVLGFLGLVYLFDFLTLPLQARFSTKTEILNFKQIQIGRFRHVIKASVEKELVPTNHQTEEVVITVAATRRALTNALRPLPGQV